MTSCSAAQTQHQYVLPFKASPEAIRGLRQAVRAELAFRGLADLASEAELVITELVTNVVRHVGVGSAAAVVLEFRADVIHAEVHDASHQVLLLAQARCASEGGHGLHLLPVIARDWGARVTSSEKAVWCDLSCLGSAASVRGRRASLVLSGYQGLAGEDAVLLLSHPRAQEQRATAVIVDLLHWLDAQGCNPDDVPACAQQSYESHVEAVA